MSHSILENEMIARHNDSQPSIPRFAIYVVHSDHSKSVLIARETEGEIRSEWKSVHMSYPGSVELHINRLCEARA